MTSWAQPNWSSTPPACEALSGAEQPEGRLPTGFAFEQSGQISSYHPREEGKDDSSFAPVPGKERLGQTARGR